MIAARRVVGGMNGDHRIHNWEKGGKSGLKGTLEQGHLSHLSA